MSTKWPSSRKQRVTWPGTIKEKEIISQHIFPRFITCIFLQHAKTQVIIGTSGGFGVTIHDESFVEDTLSVVQASSWAEEEGGETISCELFLVHLHFYWGGYAFLIIFFVLIMQYIFRN